MSDLGYDNREVPNAVSVPGDDDEEADEEPVVSAKPARKVEELLAIRTRKTAAPTQRPVSGYAAKPDVPAKRAPTSGMDTSGVRVGTTLKHKAFGNGVVHSLDSQYISVKFNGVEKKFKFPGAILDGFLEIV